MIPLRLVIDTNTLVSAVLKPDGLQRTVVLLAITKPATLYVSPGILAEYREVLSRSNLKIRKGVRQQFLQLIRNRSRSITPARQLRVTKDPDDNIFLECADTARLPGHRQYPAFSEVLEENQGDHLGRIPRHRDAASPPVNR
jgi:uncharacterized protein